VEPSYSSLRAARLNNLDEDALGQDTTPEQDHTAYRGSWRPPDRPPIDFEALQDVQPFLYFSRWANHVEGLDTNRLRALVAYPDTDDNLRNLFKAAVKFFVNDQADIKAQHEVLRWRITDEGSG
jgi:hypothetical protein